MLRIWNLVRNWFVAAPAPAAPAPLVLTSENKSFQYTVLRSHRPSVVSSGVVSARTETDALKSIYALSGERVQIIGGGRYRVQHHTDGMLYTRIDRAHRSREGDRKRNRSSQAERGLHGIVGE